MITARSYGINKTPSISCGLRPAPSEGETERGFPLALLLPLNAAREYDTSSTVGQHGEAAPEN